MMQHDPAGMVTEPESTNNGDGPFRDRSSEVADRGVRIVPGLGAGELRPADVNFAGRRPMESSSSAVGAGGASFYPRAAARTPSWLRRLVAACGTVGWITHMACAAPTDDRLHFQRLTPRDGLPAAVVYCIMEDSRGFLWFGTADGVARFDGQEFRVFRPDPDDPGSLANAGVLAMVEDALGNLWMATNDGLDLWHRDTERFSHFRHDPENPTSLSDSSIQCLELDPDGTLWVGTSRGGLDHFDPRSGRSERWGPVPSRADGQTDPWIRRIIRDHTGVLWLATGQSGLCQFNPATRRFRVYANEAGNPQSLSDNRVRCMAEDRQGNLWIGTEDGLCRLDPERRSFERHAVDTDNSGSLPNRTVTAVMVDRTGRLWIGADGGGFCGYDPATRRISRHRHVKYAGNTLESDTVSAVFEDRRGDFWIGHFPSGVSHFDLMSSPFQIFSRSPEGTNTLSDDHVLSFLEEPSGDLWVGTDHGGLNHWNAATGQWRSYRHSAVNPNSLGGKAALSILRDHRGRLWVGTWDGGLNCFQPEQGTFRRYMPNPARSNSLSDPRVWQLVEDHQNHLWIATAGGGVDRYVAEEDGFIHYRHDPTNPRSLNDNIANALLVTQNGTLWVGTPKGLARWDPTTQTWDRFQGHPDQPGTLLNHWVFDLAEDPHGMIWATTEGGGLNRLDPRTGHCASFRTAHGLPSDILRGILPDDEGCFWIGSNRGLVRFDPRTGKVRVFDESNGLPSGLFTPHARLRLDSGDFLFGTAQGFVRFNPRALKEDDRPPPVVLTKLEIDHQEVRPALPGSLLARSITETRRLEIPARFSAISIRFAALSFRSPARTQYRFKLEGFDDDWRTPGGDRRVTFTNLDPGRYRLRVKAANGDGVWNEAGATLDFTIVPPWWGTWWFRGGVALALLGGTGAVGALMTHRKAREAIREREWEAERRRVEEAKHAAEALRESEQRFRQVAENIDEVFWLTDAEKTRMVYLSPAFEVVWGRPRESLIQSPQSWLEQVHPADVERVRAAIPLQRSGGYDLEYRVVRPDGQERWIQERAFPVHDERGATYRIAGIVRDVTDRKQSEIAQARLNRELRAISNCNQALLRAGDESTILNDICGIVCHDAGYRMAWVGYADDEQAEIVRPVASAGVGPGELADSILARVPTGDGRSLLGAVLRSGASLCIQDIASDPQATPWREQALRQTCRSVVFLPLKDPNARPFGVFSIFSAEPCAFAPEEMRLLEELAGDLALGITGLRTRADRIRADDEIRRLNETLERRVQERTSDLEKKSHELRDSQMALVNLVEDLNERGHELQIANEKLKELDRLKSLFIASMSHELRTPLNSIIGFSSILVNEWLGPLTAEQKENLAAVLRSGKHLLTLINDVIDVTKIEAGKVEVNDEQFDLHDLINEAVTSMAGEARQKGLELTFEADPYTLHTDRRRLLQCILNLVSNAVRFTEKGSITVRARLADDRRMVDIAVSDTGIGMSAEDLGRLFAPFVRLDSPLRSKVLGTGLGLYLTRKLATEVLGGDVSVSSVVGRGSRFVVRVPVSIRGSSL